MLRKDIVTAVEAGLFSIWPVSTIDEGIEILTGIPAGEADETGAWPEGTVNAKVFDRLKAMAEKQKSFDEEPDDESVN